MPRDNFSAHDKDVLAKRAGYKCSLPNCKVTTIGPGTDLGTVVNTGEAAHITAASSGGARYNSSLTSEQRQSIENGIWLCRTHAALIDRDEKAYSAAVLRRFKNDHEYDISRQQRGMDNSRGLITEIYIRNLAEIKETRLELTHNNVLVGSNGMGKTLICELISGLADPVKLTRWKNKVNPGLSIFEATLFSNERCILKTSFKNGRISYSLDETELPFISDLIKTIHLEHKLKRGDNIINDIASYFDIEPTIFKNIIDYISKFGSFFHSDISIADNDVKVHLVKSKIPTSFSNLSSGEEEKVLIDIALRLSQFYSRFRPTILMIEKSAIPVLDTNNMNHIFSTLTSGNFNFQTILTYPYLLKGYITTDLSINYLVKDDTDSVVVTKDKPEDKSDGT